MGLSELTIPNNKKDIMEFLEGLRKRTRPKQSGGVPDEIMSLVGEISVQGDNIRNVVKFMKNILAEAVITIADLNDEVVSLKKRVKKLEKKRVKKLEK
jgi:hypothetical protein